MKRIVLLAVALLATASFACNHETEHELATPGKAIPNLPNPTPVESFLGSEGFLVLLPYSLSISANQPFSVSQPQVLLQELTGKSNLLEEDTGPVSLPGIPDSFQPGQTIFPNDVPPADHGVKQLPVANICSDNTCTWMLMKQSRFLRRLAEVSCAPRGMYLECCQGKYLRTYLLVATPDVICPNYKKPEDK